MEVRIISEELINPSSPTPPHLRSFKLSLLDQITPLPFGPVILFYLSSSKDFDSKNSVPTKVDLLKKSLSRVLTLLYPLAGKIRDDGLHIDCDDGGARFVEARVNMSLTKFLINPDLVLLHKFLPCEYKYSEGYELAHAANIQVNVFECGGIALAICNTHKLHDGGALSVFLKLWAAIAHQGDSSTIDTMSSWDLMAASTLFPADDLSLRESLNVSYGPLVKFGNSVTKRFLFSGIAIEALRSRANGPSLDNPTRVEVVSAFLWKCMMDALQRKNNGFRRPSVFTNTVNLRKRIQPPVLAPLGNLICFTNAYYKNDGASRDTFASLLGNVREAISKIDDHLIKTLRNDGKNFISGETRKIAELATSEDGVDHISCSSWTNFGFVDINFGWGKPIWVGTVGIPGGSITFNGIILIDTRYSNGIEVWITMDEKDMKMLEEDPDIRAFAHVNPSPLILSSKL